MQVSGEGLCCLSHCMKQSGDEAHRQKFTKTKFKIVHMCAHTNPFCVGQVNTHGHGDYGGVWLICPAMLHWRKMSRTISAGINSKEFLGQS